MDLSLSGSVVIVTGASAGIGLATVERLVEEGALVAGCARDADRLGDATTHLPRDQVLMVSCDVTDRDAVSQFMGRVEDHFGRLDGLVLNAGRSYFGTLADLVDEDLRAELDLKFHSVLWPLQAGLPLLRASGQASVVVVNALLARQPEPHLVATSAARAGVLSLAKSIAPELADQGVRINSLLLGLIDTGQWTARHKAADVVESYVDWKRRIADDRGVLLHRFGTPDEVASAVAFLVSPRSSYVTGASLEISGGIGRQL